VKVELPDWSIVYFDEADAARAKYRGAPATYDTEIGTVNLATPKVAAPGSGG
jgi:hypothetical protein